jgi:hypothetical protein
MASAIALFRRYRRVEEELAASKALLEERCLIERAKAMLMKDRKMAEPEAYRWLQKRAMNENRKLAQEEFVERDDADAAGMRGTAQPILIPYTISAGGNTVTVNCSLHKRRKSLPTATELRPSKRWQRACAPGAPRSASSMRILPQAPPALLARHGGDRGLAGSQARRRPPAHAVETLTSGQIAGFCAGAPWGEVARRAGVGVTIATSRDIWQNAPEKALAVRMRWAEERPEALAGAIRACCGPRNFAMLRRTRPTPLPSCRGGNIWTWIPTLSSPVFPAGRRPIRAASSFGVRRPFPGAPMARGSSARCGVGDWSLKVLTCAAWPSASIAQISIELPSRIWANRHPSRTGKTKAPMTPGRPRRYRGPLPCPPTVSVTGPYSIQAPFCRRQWSPKVRCTIFRPACAASEQNWPSHPAPDRENRHWHGHCSKDVDMGARPIERRLTAGGVFYNKVLPRANGGSHPDRSGGAMR